MKLNLFLAIALGIAVGCTSAAAAEKTTSVKPDLAKMAPLELPAKAAALVKSSKPADRAPVTVDVVKTCLGIKPMIAPTLVGAIAKAAPEMAALAAGTAATEQPKMAAEIATSAATAAPSQLESIVAAVCKVVPADTTKIALAVSKVAPKGGKEILLGVAAAVPESKAAIEKGIASYGQNTPVVASVLDSASRPSAGVRGPVIAPPYHNLPGTPSNLNPGDTDTVPNGGRDYAQP